MTIFIKFDNFWTIWAYRGGVIPLRTTFVWIYFWYYLEWMWGLRWVYQRPYESCIKYFEKNGILKSRNRLVNFVFFWVFEKCGVVYKRRVLADFVYWCHQITIIGDVDENWPFFVTLSAEEGGVPPWTTFFLDLKIGI